MLINPVPDKVKDLPPTKEEITEVVVGFDDHDFVNVEGVTIA